MFQKLKQFILKNQTTGQTVAKNFFWLGIGQVGSRAIKSVAIIYIARVLGANEFGVISYILGLTGFFIIFADIGVGAILNRAVAQKIENEKGYVATILVIKLILLTITTVLILTFVPFLTKIEAAKNLIPFVTLMIIFDNLRDFSIYFFRGKEKMELEALIVTIVNVSIAALSLLALKLMPNATGISIAYASSSFVSFLASAYFLREYWSIKALQFFQKNLVKGILNSAWPIAIAGLAGAFMFNVDTVMLGWWRSAEEIGWYSASQKVVGLIYVIAGLISTSTFSPIARLVQEGDPISLKSALKKIISLLSAISLPIVIGSWVLGNQIIFFIFGADYEPAVVTFYVLINLVLLMYPLNIINNLIFAYNKHAKLLIYTVISSLVNVVGNFLLIPYYGGVGAALATLIATSINFYLIYNFSKRLVRLELIKPAVKVILASLGMGVVAYGLKIAHVNLIVNVVVSTLIYLGLLFVFKEKIIGEIRSIFSSNFSPKI